MKPKKDRSGDDSPIKESDKDKVRPEESDGKPKGDMDGETPDDSDEDEGEKNPIA